MKKLILITILAGLMAAPVLAVPTIQFSQASAPRSDPMQWKYVGNPTVGDVVSGSLTWVKSSDGTSGGELIVSVVQGGIGDPLVFTGHVHLPDLTLSGTLGGSYVLTPVGGGTITITNAAGTETFLTGTLGIGDLTPTPPPGTETAGAYSAVQADITGITSPFNTIGSPVVNAIALHGTADFNLSLQGADFQAMIDSGGTGGNGFSGSITIPAPGAILLGSIGVCLVGWLKRKRTL